MTIFISYNSHDRDYAVSVAGFLKTAGHRPRIDWRDFKALESLDAFMKKTRTADRLLLLLSREYLQSVNCMKELNYFVQSHRFDDERDASGYLPIALPNASEGERSIFGTSGQLSYIGYWQDQYEQKSRQYESLISRIADDKTAKSLRHIEREIERYKEFIHSLAHFFNIVTRVRCPIKLLEGQCVCFTTILAELTRKAVAHGESVRKLDNIISSIRVPSHDDPDNPEFPPDNPSFPATPMRHVQLATYENLWIKDESKNQFGSHKDRMAWEIVVFYKKLLQRFRIDAPDEPIPPISIISSGCAAASIQGYLSLFMLPNLKVLIDRRLDPLSVEVLEKMGCELYRCDLSAKKLSSEDILALTNNENGFDLTSAGVVDPTHHHYYDWLSMEIFNADPDYVFVPCGTGQLLANIINVASSIVARPKVDRRFRGDPSRLCNTIYFGITTDDPRSPLDKLYSPFPTEIRFCDFYVEDAIRKRHCGRRSTIVRNVDTRFIDDAIVLAKQWSVDAEPSGLAGLALFLKIQGIVPPDKRVVIVNTGGMRQRYLSTTTVD